MGLFDWLAGLFGGQADETPADVADRLDRVADRFSHTGDDASAGAARTAADEARRASTTEAARRIEAEFLRSRGLRPDGRPQKPRVGRGPGDAEYVRYGRAVRTGGSRAWRYNNPGYVRCSSRATTYGAIGCDGELAIFPDYQTGVHALRMTLRDEYPGRPVGEALRQHLPPDAGIDPDRVFSDIGLDPQTKVEDLGDLDFGGLDTALEAQPGWESGEQFDRDAGGGPEWVQSAWDDPGTTDALSTAADAGSEAADEVAPTDNS
jgi:hypothetical protein